MMTNKNFSALGANIVYLRPIATADLPEDIRDQAGSRETLFAVHNTKGEQVALVADAAIASHLAAANNMELVTVH